MSGLITQQELCAVLSKKIDDSDTNSKLNRQQIGALTSLKTTNKTNLVNSINELYNNTVNGKNLIGQAITQKGVSASGNDSYQTLHDKILQIKTGYSREDIESGRVIFKLRFQINNKISNRLYGYTMAHSSTSDPGCEVELRVDNNYIYMKIKSQNRWYVYDKKTLNLVKEEYTIDNIDKILYNDGNYPFGELRFAKDSGSDSRSGHFMCDQYTLLFFDSYNDTRPPKINMNGETLSSNIFIAYDNIDIYIFTFTSRYYNTYMSINYNITKIIPIFEIIDNR